MKNGIYIILHSIVFVQSRKNTINDDEEEHIYLLPCIFPSDGKLSEKAYNHISQDFYVLHKGFPCAQDDINKDHTVQQDAQNFCVERKLAGD